MKQKHLLNLFVLLVCMIMGAGTAWAEDKILFSTDFTESAWETVASSKGEISSGTKVTLGETQITLAAGNNRYYQWESGILTWSDNNYGTNDYIAIPVSGVNGSLTITISNGSSTTSFKYGINSVGSGTATTSAVNSTSGSVTVDGSNATVYVGRNGSGNKTISSITITTPENTTPVDPTPTRYTAPTITINGNWMTVSQTEGQGATMFWKYTRTKAGDISNTNHDAGEGTSDDSKGTFIPYGRYPAEFIQAICVDMTNPTGEGSLTSEITKYGDSEFTVAPSQPTVEMSGTNKVKFTMQGQTTSCYFEYKIGESGEIQQIFNVTEYEIDITSAEKIYVWTSASYKYRDNVGDDEATGYVGSGSVEFTPTYTPDAAFEITTQPESKTYNYKATATALSVVAVSEHDLTYQWYSNTEDNNTNGTIITDATAASYTPSTEAVGTTYYYCVVTEGTTNATLTSNTAKIDVIVPKPSVATPENVVTISGSVAGAKFYYTLDKSDPVTSDTRIEYSPNTVAIHEGMTKVRAVAYVDGYYSAIQGVEVTYEPVTVLEARGKKVNAQSTFTNSTCVTSVAFGNDNKAQWGISPNSDIEESVAAYRSSSSSTASIQLTSTSANKIVLSGYSGGSDARTIKSIYVDGVKLTEGTDYDIIRSTNNKSLRKDIADRIVISLKSGHEIPQNADVTFNMSGGTYFCYYEVYGSSKTDFCEMPDVAPANYSSADNLWSYTLTPAAGTTMKYVIVDPSKGEPLAGYPKESTEVVTISKSTESNLKAGLMIRAWSVDPAGVKVASGKAFATVESLLTPTLKFNVAEAKYNKDGNKYTTATPILTVYPASFLSRVTFNNDDASVGYGTNGQTGITIGSGQGLTTIDANLTVAEGTEGMKPGDYKATLKLLVADGIGYGLSEDDKGDKPKIRTTIDIEDPETGELLLTMMYGGYKYKNGKFNGGTTDSWDAVDKFAGYNNGETKLSDAKKYVDGYAYNSQASQDSRSEAYVDTSKGSVEWFSTSEKKADGTNYAKYERIKPFSLPVRGAYFTFEPQVNGVLTLYVLQNGSLNTTSVKEGDNNVDYVTGLSANPRAYYWFDQEGYRIEPTSVIVKQPLTFGYDAKNKDGNDVLSSVISSWKDREEYTNDEKYKNSLDLWVNQTAIEENLAKADPDPQPIIRYREGYVLLQKAHIKYVVNVVAGKTYYFFSNNSKLGFAGVNFKKTSAPTATLELTQTDDVADKKSTQTTTYKTVTLNRTFKQNTWNTITLPFALSETQIEKVFGKGTKVILFNGTDGPETGLKAHFLEHVDQNILPGQPYFILPTGVDKNGNDLASVSNDKIGGNGGLTFNNVCITSDVALQTYGSNVYNGAEQDFEFVGTFAPTDVFNGDYYINANNGNLTKYTGNSTTMNTYRAYLKNSTTASAKAISGVDFGSTFENDGLSDEDATAIMNVLVNEMGVEIKPVNGIYNLAGQKVAESTKDLPAGIYIVNGKKISIK